MTDAKKKRERNRSKAEAKAKKALVEKPLVVNTSEGCFWYMQGWHTAFFWNSRKSKITWNSGKSEKILESGKTKTVV